jgi:hypothetical protein
MSTIVTSNVSDGTLSIPTTYVTNGSAKAWVNFGGTGTIAVRDSLNVTSLTDNGTGDYTVNFSNAFDAATYSAVSNSGAVGTPGTIGRLSEVQTILVGSTRVLGFNQTPTALDWDLLCLNVHGDLA